MEFTNKLAAIHAYLCADGYVIKNPPKQKNKYYYIGFRNFEDTLLDDFEDKFKQTFNIQPRRAKDGRSIIQNKQLYLQLTKNHCYYSANWTTPKLTLNQSKYWLRAYFDCEGWVYYKKAKNRCIGIDSINKEGIKYIQKILLQFKIESKLKEIKKRNIWRLLIYKKENLQKFQKHIDFLHPKKQIKLQEALDSYKTYKWDFSDENKLLKQLLKDKQGKRLRFNSIIKANIDQLSNLFVKLHIHHTTSFEKNKHSNYHVLCINSI